MGAVVFADGAALDVGDALFVGVTVGTDVLEVGAMVGDVVLEVGAIVGAVVFIMVGTSVVFVALV